MTDQAQGRNGDRRDLAAELALGVLEGEELMRAHALVQEDAAFAAEVDRWREHLAGLARAVPEQAPARDLWPEVRARIAGDARPAPVARLVPRPRGVGFWRAWALAASLAAVALGGLVWRYEDVFGPSRRLVVVLEPAEEQRTAWLLAIEPRTHAVTPVATGAPPPDDDRVQELWIIPPGGAPHSLGLIEDRKTVYVPDPLASPEATFAVSLEPPGGSPTGAPTGPVVYTGAIRPFPLDP